MSVDRRREVITQNGEAHDVVAFQSLVLTVLTSADHNKVQ